jgi:hypothetical protein
MSQSNTTTRGQLILFPIDRTRAPALELAYAARAGDATAAVVFEHRYGVSRRVWQAA